MNKLREAIKWGCLNREEIQFTHDDPLSEEYQPQFKGISFEQTPWHKMLNEMEYQEEMATQQRVKQIQEYFDERTQKVYIERNNRINNLLSKLVDGLQSEEGNIAPATTNECNECMMREGRYGYSKETLLAYMKIAFDFGQRCKL